MQWIENVRESLREAGRVCDGLAGTRSAIYGLWLAIDGTPPNVRDLYRTLDEGELVDAAAKLDFADVFQLPWTQAGDRLKPLAVVEALAIRLRSLEALYYELLDGAVVRRAADCIATFGRESAYLLPREPLYRKAKTGDRFRRRGLRLTRLLPTRIAPFDVELIFADDPRGRDRLARGCPRLVGAGLFEDVEFTLAEQADGFLVQDVSCPSQLAVIQRQIANASAEGCLGVVYPELTISTFTLAEVRRHLAEADHDANNVSIVVAGSRHEQGADGAWYNAASILDGYGQPIAEHRKLYRYLEPHGTNEAIETGTAIQVVVLEQVVVTFGICLDFCNTSEEPPYLELDVDVVVIPSCGNPSTMEGHIKRSTTLMDNLKARAVVVQQFYSAAPTPDDPLGYVLARVSGLAPTTQSLERREPWAICCL